MTHSIRSRTLGGVTPQPGTYTIQVPVGTELIAARVRTSDGKLTLWGMVNDSVSAMKDLTFTVIEDDTPFATDVQAMRYVDSDKGPNGPLHIFELYFDGERR